MCKRDRSDYKYKFLPPGYKIQAEMCRLHIPEYLHQIAKFLVIFYLKQIKNMQQSIEEERVSYSETYRKRGLNSSLTYCKCKNKHANNNYNLLRSSKFGGYTAYWPPSIIRRIETQSMANELVDNDMLTDHHP